MEKKHHFERAFIKVNKSNFLDGEQPISMNLTDMNLYTKKLRERKMKEEKKRKKKMNQEGIEVRTFEAVTIWAGFFDIMRSSEIKQVLIYVYFSTCFL